MKKPEPTPRGTVRSSGCCGCGRWRGLGDCWPGGWKSGPKNQRNSSAGSLPPGPTPRIGTVAVDQGEFVLLGSEVLNLTEPRFTVKLKVNASDRAKLAVGQETLVDLKSSGQDSVPGVITQLDDTVTVADDKSQTYEGVVEVKEEPKGVDGASVSIEIGRAHV